MNQFKPNWLNKTQLHHYSNLPDNCTLNDVYDLVDKAKKLIALGSVNPDNGIQLELFPL